MVAAVNKQVAALTPFDYEADDILSLSHSSLSGTYDACPRKLQLRKVLNVRRNTASYAGNAGSAMHNGWYEYLKGHGLDAAAWQLMRDFPIQWQKSPMDDRSLQACYGSLMALIKSPILAQYELAYVNRNGVDEPAIEVPFALHVLDENGDEFVLPRQDGPPLRVVYIGYVDLIVYDVMNDTYLVVDLKTTTKDLPDYNVMFQFDKQCLPYALVLERMLGRAIHNLSVMYAVVKIDHLEPRVIPLHYEKDATDIQEWVRLFAMRLRDMRTFAETEWWPRRQKACTGFQVCQYAASGVCGSRNLEFIRDQFNLHVNEANEPEQEARPKFEPWFRVDLQIGGLS